mgnify:CR=1 FL=1
MKIMAQSEVSSWENQLRQIDNSFYNAGYDFKLSDEDGVPKITVTAREEGLPTIDIKTEADVDQYFVCTLSFPTLQSPDHGYLDNVEYYLDKWQKVGKVITELSSIILDNLSFPQ